MANVVVDYLCRITMGSVSHIDEVKKNLAREVNRFAVLGVRFESALDGGATVHCNYESPLVVEVKSKQHIDLAFGV